MEEEHEAAEKEKEEAEKLRAIEEQRTKRERLSLLHNTESSLYYQHMIPNKHFKSIRADSDRIYGGRFTSAGNLYYCSS